MFYKASVSVEINLSELQSKILKIGLERVGKRSAKPMVNFDQLRLLPSSFPAVDWKTYYVESSPCELNNISHKQ